MRAGLLNRIIEVYKPNVTKNAYGENVETMQLAYQTRARVIHKGGSQSVENKEVIYPYLYTFEVYRYNVINETDEIRYNGKKYEILSIDDNRENNKLTIETKVVNE